MCTRFGLGLLSFPLCRNSHARRIAADTKSSVAMHSGLLEPMLCARKIMREVLSASLPGRSALALVGFVD